MLLGGPYKNLNFACIYMITVVFLNGDTRKYIGQTVKLSRRYRDYINEFATINYEDRHVWINFLQHQFGVLDFERDFNMQVIEIIDKGDMTEQEFHDLLDEREKYWIAYYDTCDKTFQKGFNYTIGGTGYIPSGANYIVKSSASTAIHPRFVFLYDRISKNIVMYCSIKSISDIENFSIAAIGSSAARSDLCLGRYRIYDILYEARYNKILEVCEEKYNQILDKLNSRTRINFGGLAVAINTILTLILDYLDFEYLIFDKYRFDDTNIAPKDMLSRLSVLHEYIVKLCKISALVSCDDICEELDPSVYQGNAVYVFRDNEYIGEYENCRSAMLELKGVTRLKTPNFRMRKPKAFYGRYYVYYKDEELREEIFNDSRGYVPKSERERSQKFQYTKNYFKLRRMNI